MSPNILATSVNADPERRVALLAVITALLAIGLVGLSAATGNTHLAFQFLRESDAYTAMLVERGSLLRLELGLDNVFLCVYTVFFILLSDLLRRWRLADAGIPVWLALLVGSALFDMFENANLLTMLTAVEHGSRVEPASMNVQAVVGQCKFLLNYAGLLALSFKLPLDNFMERALVAFLRWAQAPLGVAVLVLPVTSIRPFAITRTIGFIAALLTFAWVVRSRRNAH